MHYLSPTVYAYCLWCGYVVNRGQQNLGDLLYVGSNCSYFSENDNNNNKNNNNNDNNIELLGNSKLDKNWKTESGTMFCCHDVIFTFFGIIVSVYKVQPLASISCQ